MNESASSSPDAPHDNPSSTEPLILTWHRKVRRILVIFNIIVLISLATIYLGVGDQTAWGEYFAIWPSFFWTLPMLPFLLLGTSRQHWKFTLVQWLVLFLFLLLTVEWRSLMRHSSKAAFSEYVEELKREGAFPLSVVTWNIDSAGKKAILDELAPLTPDLCFFQETSDGAASFQREDLVGAWEGYHWFDNGDCGILSRFPATALELKTVGPWDKPLGLLVELPNGQKVACIDVRLMLPSLVLNPFSSASRSRLVGDHRTRVAQFPALFDVIMQIKRDHKPDAIILAGDFNTPGGAYSMRILHKGLRDVWPECGRGWGATMTASFPVSRIDQCWVSSNVKAYHARVIRSIHSDHRLLFVDLAVLPAVTE